MKLSILTAAFLLMNLCGFCQSAENAEKVLSKLSALYNKEEYPALYAMLSPEFKAKMSEAQATAFYKVNLRQAFGNMQSWKLKDNSSGTFNYLVQMERGKLDLALRLNDKDEIAGMMWVPAKEEYTGKKRDAATIRSNNPKQTAVQKLLDSLAVAHLQNPTNCGLSIALINGDKTDIYFYGSTNKTTEKLPDNATLYEIGSVTKTFTGTILAHAIHEVRIDEDDDIRKYLHGEYTNLQFKGRPIRIKDLSDHTSRLPRIPANLDKQPDYDPRNPYKNYTISMFLEYLKTVKLDTIPGTVNEYSNYGVALLGIILEDVYKKPMKDLVAAYVAAPAGMTNTKFTVGINDKQHLATGYNGEDGAETSYWDLGVFKAAGGLKSNIADMAAYVKANMKEVNEDFQLAHKPIYHDPKMSVGLNWIISPFNDWQTMIWHNGGTYGFTSFAGYIKESKKGVVILNNSGIKVDDMAIQLLKMMDKEK